MNHLSDRAPPSEHQHETTLTNAQRWPTAIDIFCGAGGMSLGLRQARFRVVAAVDNAPLAVDSYRLNFPLVPVVPDDIRGVSGAALMAAAGLRPGEIDLLAGCPPCQGFSALRTKRRQSAVADERNDLILEFLRLAAEIRPRMVLMENVPGLAGDALFRRFCSGLEALSYGVSSAVLDSADYGTPQKRRRLVLVAAQGSTPRLAPGDASIRTVRDAIGDMADTAGRSDDPLHDHGERRAARVGTIIRAIPHDGGSRSDLEEDDQLACHQRATARGDGWGRDSYARMAWDKPAPTITGGCVNPGKGRFLHPEQDRAITVREALILQGFPPGYQLSFVRGKFAAADLAGNAVPPPFVKAQALALRRMLPLPETDAGLA